MNKNTTSPPVSGLQYQDSIMQELTDTQTQDDIIFCEINELSQLDDFDENSLFKVVRKDNACRLIKMNTQTDSRKKMLHRFFQTVKRPFRFMNNLFPFMGKGKKKDFYFFIKCGEWFFDLENVPSGSQKIQIKSARIKGKLDLLFHRHDFFAWARNSAGRQISASDIGQFFKNEFSEWLTAAVKSVENPRLLKQYRENAINWEKQDCSRLPVWFTVLEVTDLNVKVQLGESESVLSSTPETETEKSSGNWLKKGWNWVVNLKKRIFR